MDEQGPDQSNHEPVGLWEKVVEERLADLDNLSSLQIEPWPVRFDRTHTTAEIRDLHGRLEADTRTEEMVAVAGRGKADPQFRSPDVHHLHRSERGIAALCLPNRHGARGPAGDIPSGPGRLGGRGRKGDHHPPRGTLGGCRPNRAFGQVSGAPARQMEGFFGMWSSAPGVVIWIW